MWALSGGIRPESKGKRNGKLGATDNLLPGKDIAIHLLLLEKF